MNLAVVNAEILSRQGWNIGQTLTVSSNFACYDARSVCAGPDHQIYSVYR